MELFNYLNYPYSSESYSIMMHFDITHRIRKINKLLQSTYHKKALSGFFGPSYFCLPPPWPAFFDFLLCLSDSTFFFDFLLEDADFPLVTLTEVDWGGGGGGWRLLLMTGSFKPSHWKEEINETKLYFVGMSLSSFLKSKMLHITAPLMRTKLDEICHIALVISTVNNGPWECKKKIFYSS